MTAAQLFVKCLENEGVEYIFGIPGEENIDIMDALLESPITFVTTHHEPGAAFIDFPENIAEMNVDKKPIKVQTAYTSITPDHKIEQAVQIISKAKFPVILAGNGVIRQAAADSLVTFAEVLRIPVANTFMAKGVMPFNNDPALGT